MVYALVFALTTVGVLAVTLPERNRRSGLADFITGVTLPVDGDYSIY